jgi:hypothetical protein
MQSRVDEYLQKAAECDAKAQAAEQADIGTSFRTLAEHWRRLAKIVADKSETPIRPDRNQAMS